MASIVMVISAIAIIVITSGAGNMQLGKNLIEDTPFILDRCPPFSSTDVIVKVSGANCPMLVGCATIDFPVGERFPSSNTFSVWVGHMSSRISSCFFPNSEDMERTRFSCEMISPTEADYKNESLHVMLYGRIVQPELKPNIRCALYKLIKNNQMDYHMAISKDRSCKGLPAMLSYPFPPGPEGSISLHLKRPIITD